MSEISWSVHTLPWNDPRYFFDLLSSIEQQVGTEAQTVLIEHRHSGALSSTEVDHRRCTILRNAHDKGFSASHQQALTLALSHWSTEEQSQRYVALVHPDVVFEPHCLLQVQRFFEARSDCHLLLPKVLRAGLKFSETGEQREVIFQEEEDIEAIPCVFIRASFAGNLSWKKISDFSQIVARVKSCVCSDAIVWHHHHPLPPPTFSAKVRGLFRL